MQPPPSKPSCVVFERDQLSSLFEALQRKGYTILGPTIQNGAIVLDALSSVGDLPVGWTSGQEKANYRVKPRSEQVYFGFTVGPHSWKQYLHVPVVRLWSAHRGQDGLQFTAEHEPVQKQAFLGVRACELHAILIQDRVLMEGDYVDPAYKARRENTLIITVNCTEAGGTCFCASMGTGPGVDQGFDLALTEILTDDHHYFVAQVGSNLGEEILKDVVHSDARDEDCRVAAEGVARAAGQMGRSVDTANLRDLLVHSAGHPRWEKVGSRCMTCGNCTLVCPTCFCTTVEDTTDLTGANAERRRRWDSCFTMDFSYIHGGTIRATERARYRQWMTHKFATWIDQFGQSGCVGCGRCITWCPVGIDVTEEIAAIRSAPPAGKKPPSVKETYSGNA